MSARVFNPVVMELRRAMRGPGGGSAAADATALAAMPTAAAAASAPDFGLQAPARVRRNLFGPVDHEESRRFVERELAAISKRDEDLYEFDFSRERPREGPTRRFSWERVQPGGVPESYALRRLAFLGAAAATATVAAAAATAASSAAASAPDATAAMPPPAATHDAAAAQAIASAAADPAEAAATPAEPPCTPAPVRTRQSFIGEFMRTRKRPSSGSSDPKVATSTKRSSSPPPTPSKVRKASTTLEATGTTSRLS